MAIRVGDLLGDYQVTGVLGRGGMGKVFRVRSVFTERDEAMKVVLPDIEENPDLVDRFLREIKLHASLRHPNIAELRAALRIGERLVMILELVDGMSLEERLRQGAIDVASSVGLIMQVLSALAYAHERGVVHRDIKPANILIDKSGVVKLTDFGIAFAAGGTRLTGHGLAVGTLSYMSPEQIHAGQTDARSDIYSLGLTFYEMVTGRPAVAGDTDHAMMDAQLNVVPPDPAVLNPLVARAVSAAILRALAKDPGHRFQTAGEFQSALGGVGEVRSAMPPAANPVPSAMPPAAVAVSAAELSEVEARLSRVLGPIAKRLVSQAAHRYGSISEIRAALAAEIEDPKARQHFLKTDTGGGTAPTTGSVAPVSFDAGVLDRLGKALAPYLGPIAKVVVNRAARGARSLEDLLNTLAAEIPSAEDRRRFLAAARSAL